MPTVLRSGPYRFFFYSSCEGEPSHVHVVRENPEAKHRLDPVALAFNRGFSRRELRDIHQLGTANRDAIQREWDAFFHR